MPEPGPLGPLLDRARVAFGRSTLLSVLAIAAVAGAVTAAAALFLVPRVAAGSALAATDPAVALPRAVRITTTAPPPPPLVIYVGGAVVQPGLVQLPDGARVADAVAAAGGLRPDADAGRLNLAEKLRDGARLYVLAVGEVVAPPVAGQVGTPGANPGSTATGDGTGGAPVDLNTATEAELDALPGVGPATAAAIVAHRGTIGRFSSVEQLADVRGIGPAKLETLRPLVRV